MRKVLFWFAVLFVVFAYTADYLGFDFEEQREESRYYEACKCRYNYRSGGKKGATLPLRAPDLREERIFKKLEKLHGISDRGYILCATNKDIPNGFAGFATRIDGRRYIVYDRKYATSSKEIYVVSLFGHEIGHQYLDHVYQPNKDYDYRQEIEAEEFSGWSLFKWGYSHSTAVNSQSTSQKATKTHPSGTVKRNAVSRGWKQAAAHEAKKR